MIARPGPVPQQSDITADKFKDHRLAQVFRDWFNAALNRINAAVTVLCNVITSDVNAAIATAVIPTGPLNTGLYRISWYIRVTRPGAVSSSLTLTLGWVDAGVAMTSTSAAIVGNLVTSFQSGSIVVAADVNTALTYAVAYASAGAVSAKYKIGISVESLQ